jgi:hypothetical protein
MATNPVVQMVCTESFAFTTESDGVKKTHIIGQGQSVRSDHPAVDLCPERFVPAQS